MTDQRWRWGLRRDSGVAQFALRLSFIAIGLGAIVFGTLAYISLITEISADQLVWNLAQFAVIIGLPILLGCLASIAPTRILRIGGIAYSLLYLIALVLWIAGGPQGINTTGQAWIISITALPATSLMAALPRPSSWAYLPVVGALTAAVAIRSSTSAQAVPDGLLTGMYAMTFDAIFVGFIFVSLRWTKVLDNQLAAAALEQAEAEASRARLNEQNRFRAMVHDSVISTLLMAGRDAAPTEVLADQAQLTLVHMRERDLPALMPVRTLAEGLKALVDHTAPTAEWQQTVVGDLELNGLTADVVFGAAAEALRNAVRYSGGHGESNPAAIAVSLNADATAVQIVVRDAGVGFDQSSVPENRMGIRRSIVKRCETVGAVAQVSSAIGQGTTVTIGWSR